MPTETVIDLYAEAGLYPTDEATDDEGHPVAWLDRWAAYTTVADGYLVASTPDPEAELYLAVLTPSGVIRSEARFDLTSLGRAMFAAAVEAAHDLIGTTA